MLTGTNYFVSRDAAIRYYADYGISGFGADRKLMIGEIFIGKPPNLKPGESLVLMDEGQRYGIDDGKPSYWAVCDVGAPC